jgi:hypothetical protein
MSNSAQHIQTRLHNQTEADDSEIFVDHSRYHYRLLFEKNVGWDWLTSQVYKVDARVDVDVELYKIAPAGTAFAAIVREVDRRANIDDSQESLFDFS